MFQYYPETDRRRQDVLQGQFVEVRQQLEEDAEVVEDPPVPVVIKGEKILSLKPSFFLKTIILTLNLIKNLVVEF